MPFPNFAELSQRIEKLRSRKPNEMGKWGKMNLGQMLVHCRLPYDTALGRLQAAREDTFVSRNIIGPLILKIPWPKGTPTAKDFRTVEMDLPVRGMHEEIEALLEAMRAHSAKPFQRTVSPVFGPMALAHWEGLMRRHLDYHLGQFGG